MFNLYHAITTVTYLSFELDSATRFRFRASFAFRKAPEAFRPSQEVDRVWLDPNRDSKPRCRRRCRSLSTDFWRPNFRFRAARRFPEWQASNRTRMHLQIRLEKNFVLKYFLMRQ